MPGFTNLKEGAQSFPQRLGTQFQAVSGCNGFFSLSRTWLCDRKMLKHAELLRDISAILDNEKMDEGQKYNILLGAYFYVWSHYHDSLSYWLSAMMIKLLQEDCEHASLAQISPLQYKTCLQALAGFLSDIAIHTASDSYRLLYTKQQIPADIQSILYELKLHQPEDTPGYQVSWSGLMKAFG